MHFTAGLTFTFGDVSLAPGERAVIVRDAATSDGLIPLWKLERFSHLKPHQVRLAYESGEKVLRFLEAEYGLQAATTEEMAGGDADRDVL